MFTANTDWLAPRYLSDLVKRHVLSRPLRSGDANVLEFTHEANKETLAGVTGLFQLQPWNSDQSLIDEAIRRHSYTVAASKTS